MNLPPFIYDAIQHYVHNGHVDAYNSTIHLLGLKKKDKIIEVGCGTGSVAKHFINNGHEYWGFDIEEDRIKMAQEKFPKGNFLVGDVNKINDMQLPNINNFYMHAFLHHLNDEECNKIIDHVLSKKGRKLVIFEPIRPDIWWKKPMSTLMVNMDDGNYIRTLDEWKELFGNKMTKYTIKSFLPRYPATVLEVLLTKD